MDNQIPEDPYRILARERSHEDARQTVATNRMLVQSLVIINGGAATAVLAYYGAHNASGPGKSAALLTIILYCLGVFTAIFAGLYVRRTTQEWSSFWELKSYPDMAEREKVMEGHRQQALSKRWSTGLLVFSEVFFLAANCSPGVVSVRVVRSSGHCRSKRVKALKQELPAWKPAKRPSRVT
jgi:hypothetical protein